jgi:hypothetical protein
MRSFFGKIKILNIDNKPPAERGEMELTGFLPLETGAVKFIHYPDSQQLIIWLPRPGKDYGTLRLRDTVTGEIIDDWPVANKLNGAIQILWDTVSLPPGHYRIEIDHPDSCKHIIDLIKYEEGAALPDNEVTLKQPESNSEPILYRDGFGNIIENEDLRLREKMLKEITDKFSRHIEYGSSGRAGTIFYAEGETRIPFYYEFGGGNCVAYIDIPTIDKWESETKTPVGRRDDIIQFTATMVQARQAPDCRIEICDTAIKFFLK